MCDSGDENDGETSLEGVDAAGGSQACGEGRGEGDGGAAVSECSVWDVVGAAMADSFAAYLGGKAAAPLLLLFSLGGSE